jgi:hypothetical protein
MEALGGRGGIAPTHSRPRPLFTPGESTPGTHCTGGWVGPRAGLDTEDRGKNHFPPPGVKPRSPGRPARSQDTILPELTRLLMLFKADLYLP